MLDQVSTASRVPSEFIGIARQFRTKVKAVDITVDTALDVITKPLILRLRRKPKLRAETLPIVVKQYNDLIPVEFRIGALDRTQHKTEFTISEMRLCAGWLRDDHWNDPEMREPGVSLCRFTLSVHAGQLRRRWTPTCTVSLHALARRVERGRDRSTAALVRDIAVLADAGDEGDRVDTDGGFWLGGVINANDRDTGHMIRLRSIRTWLNTDG